MPASGFTFFKGRSVFLKSRGTGSPLRVREGVQSLRAQPSYHVRAKSESIMKKAYGFSLCFAGLVVILALAVFFTGCTQPSSPAPAVTPAPTSGQVSPAGVPSPVAASLPYGVTIAVPGDWKQQAALTTGVRDYGKDTTNIANFFSPNEIPGDSASYNSLGIDVDQNVQQDFDTYFNQATIAVGKTYGTQMQAHSITLKIGGYDSYELDFQTADVKGTYIFTNTK
jgi:hypothetical protein